MKSTPPKIASFVRFIALAACLPASVGYASQPPATQKQRDLVRAEAALSAVKKRVALVIGNKDYADAPLKNPVNDAQSIAAALKGLGFEVILKTNLTNRQMAEAVDDFAQQLDKNSIGLFYFSGHGIQVGGVNYLVPIGYNIKRQADVAFEAFPAQRLLDTMGGSGCTLNLVILDACRNNPLPKSIRSAGDKGLGKMDAPSGTLVAYATAPGQTASDDPDKNNGLYTGVLLDKMKMPGLKIEEVFKLTRVSVKAASAGQQTPWEESSLENDFYFLANASPAPVVPAAPVPIAPVPKPAPAKPATASFAGAVSTLRPLLASFAEQAEQNAQKINNENDKSRAFSLIASAQSRSENPSAAKQSLVTAEQIAQTIPSAFSKGLALDSVVSLQARNGDITTAIKTTQAITDPFCKTRALFEVAAAQARAGNTKAAILTAQSLPEPADQTRALCAIVAAQAQSGDKTSARQTLLLAQKSVEKDTNLFLQGGTLYDIAQAQAHVGDIAEAIQTADAVPEANDKARVLCIIAVIQAQQGNASAARQTLQIARTHIEKVIPDSETIYKSSAWGSFASAQARSGDITAALQTVQSIGRDEDKVAPLADIARAQAQTGNAQAAQQTLRTASQIAQALPDSWSKARAFGTIVERFYQTPQDK